MISENDLISLDKFILLVLAKQPSSIEEINGKIILFISSIWYQQWDVKNKSILNTLLDNFARIRYYLKSLFKRPVRTVYFSNGFIDTENEIEYLIRENLVEFKEDKYYLTENGVKKANKIKKDIVNKANLINNQFFQISQAERNNTLINFFLAILKLSGGYLSGSVALISDGYDAISDTISAFFVWVGLKFDYQKITNLLVIVMLFVAGFSALYESGNKLYKVLFATAPIETHVGIVIVVESIAILAAIFLFTYERHIGRFKNNLTLISQSVDSKNHILTGLVVIIGSLFSIVGIHWIDAIIGLYIAFRILSDSVDLVKEFKSEISDGNVDYSKYKTFFGNYMNLNHDENFITWVLYNGIEDYIDKTFLIDSYSALISNDYCPLISELGISFNQEINYDDVLNKLYELNFIDFKEGKVKTTQKGIINLDKILKSFSNFDVNLLDFFILQLSNE